MVFLALLVSSCAAAGLLVLSLRRSSRLLVHLFDDQPASKAPAIAGPPRLTLVSNRTER